jgi:hypothetical protein
VSAAPAGGIAGNNIVRACSVSSHHVGTRNRSSLTAGDFGVGNGLGARASVPPVAAAGVRGSVCDTTGSAGSAIAVLPLGSRVDEFVSRIEGASSCDHEPVHIHTSGAGQRTNAGLTPAAASMAVTTSRFLCTPVGFEIGMRDNVPTVSVVLKQQRV